jgi:outer membrane protein OmpA-like peptidoglycan-associated protein
MRSGGPRVILVASLLALLGACAAPKAVLLPGEDGHATGALAVLNENGQERVLDQPLERARMARRGASVRRLSEINPAYRRLMATMPPPAYSYTLYFYEGTTTIVPSSRPVLEAIKGDVAVRPGAEIEVTGHTDTVGSEDDNDRLSMLRAEEIMRTLIAEGMPRDATSAVGRGEREPAVDTGDNVANIQNRRVEVIVR